MEISFRSVVPTDEAFLLRLYRTTREREMEIAGLPEEERDKFIRFQFFARKKHYDEFYGDAENLVVLKKKKPIGRHMLLRRDNEYRLVLTELLPEHQGGGIGSKLVQDFLDEATEAGKPVRLQILKYGGPLKMLERLGFAITTSNDFFHSLEWLPPGFEKVPAEEMEKSSSAVGTAATDPARRNGQTSQ